MLIDCAGGAYLDVLGDVRQLDVVVVVVEPYPRSGEVARRLLETMSAKAPSVPVLVVANKIGQDADLDAVRSFLPGAKIDAVVPLDQGIVKADADGLAAVDVAANGPAVNSIMGLAAMLLAAPPP